MGDGDEPPTEDRAIVDSGLKALAFDSGPRWFATSPPQPMSAPPTSTPPRVSAATNWLGLGERSG
jgi:hypothetical protein